MEEEINANFSAKAREDYILAKEAVGGDQRAYEKLTNRYKDMIYFTILKMINNKQDAEDLTIETFAKAFLNLEQYKPSYAFSTWLFRIATNTCIDFLRRKNAKLKSAMKDIENGLDSLRGKEVHNPEKILMKNQRKEFVIEILGKMNPDYKLLIELRFFKELSYDEIAKELGIPLGTVKAKLFRAKQLLYDLLVDKSQNYL
jgi:RNA polymerase sigma-70 factor (ECF subfamily)